MRVRAREDCHRALPDGRINPSITSGREYVVFGYDESRYRLANDRGEPCLYEKLLFDVVDPSEDPTWVRRDGEDGDYYVDPPECSAPGFYERWHDRDLHARRLFAEVQARLLAQDALGKNRESK